jgi:hypothetical protein
LQTYLPLLLLAFFCCWRSAVVGAPADVTDRDVAAIGPAVADILTQRLLV